TVVIALITVFFALQLPKARLDNNNFRFVPEKDPARLESVRIDEIFGSQIYIMVGLERKHGTVLDAEFLKTLRQYTKKLTADPVIGEVTSIVSTDYITGSADSIIVEPLVPDSFTGTSAEIATLRDRLLSWDLYKRALVSDDFSSTQVLVSLNLTAETAGNEQAVEAYRSIKRLAYEAGFKGTKIYIAGMPVFSAVINDAMAADLLILIPLVVIVVLGILFLSFRRIGGIVLPMLTVVVSSIWAIGLMAFLGVKLSIMSTVLPVILVAIGSAYGIHVVSHYYDETAGKRNLGDDEHRRIIFAVMRKIGRPVLLAALTTLAGFISLCFTPVVPISEFGVFATFGVLVAFVVSITLIPALLILRGPKAAKAGAAPSSDQAVRDPLSEALADALVSVSRKRRTVLFLSSLVVVFSLFGITRLIIDNVMIEYFKPDTDMVQSDGFIRKYFGGSKTISVVVSTENRGDVLDPAVLGAMDGLSRYLEQNVSEVGKAAGFTDLVKRINQVFNADEKPDGLATRTNVAPAAGAASFGFGTSASSGEAAFGFGSFDSPTAEKPLAVSVDAKPKQPSETLDELKMVALLSKALGEGGRSGMSADELVNALKRATNYQGAAYYEIPVDPKRYGKKDAKELKDLISSYLVLLSGNIESYADDPMEPRSIRMSLQLRTVGQQDTDRVINEIRDYIDENFPKNVKVTIGGPALVEGALNRLVVQSQIQSIFFSLLTVFLILAVYYRSLIAGVIGLVPLSISVLINFGVMGFFGIKLNIGTAMISSITVGTGIDYIIHYLAAYHHEFLAMKNGGDFFRRTFLSSGKAILFNAISVGAGFAVLAFSQFTMLAYFGILVALAMATSATVSLTLLPILLNWLKPAFIRRPMPFDDAKISTEVL
ncbi:MAG: MMPL family transporter, partial [Treponemataceae bacterium]